MKTVLLFGANGMLGKVLLRELSKKFRTIPATRSDCDLSDLEGIEDFVLECNPNYIINTAAIVNLDLCEQYPELAFKVNAQAVSKMALAANKIGAQLIQISTDHYYLNSGPMKHSETNPISIVNSYAYSKFSGEIYAKIALKNLIIRTNIIGFKDNKNSFLDWAFEKIYSTETIRLFDDFFCSSIDIWNFSEILVKCIDKELSGLYNISSRDVLSKATFVNLLAQYLGINLRNFEYKSVIEESILSVRRANSLGLDVSKVEKDLGQNMYNSEKVIKKIIEVYHDSQSKNSNKFI